MSSFTQEEIELLQDHINSLPRNILDGKTAYKKALELFSELIELLDCKYIELDKVNRSNMFIKKIEKED